MNTLFESLAAIVDPSDFPAPEAPAEDYDPAECEHEETGYDTGFFCLACGAEVDAPEPEFDPEVYYAGRF